MKIYYVQASGGREVQPSVALDASGAVRSGYRRQQTMEPGEYASFNIALMDGAPSPAPSMLRDAAGKPARLMAYTIAKREYG